ncbi:MAG: VOC family protein [Candidatus Sumerlaeaceae bacterium]|nr:VOC family protein [Candidatus Sumerlaeaceae bacterium]
MKRTITITNNNKAIRPIYVEPLSDDFWMLPGQTFELRAEAKDESDQFEVVDEDGCLVVHPSLGMGFISVFCNDQELQCGHQRPVQLNLNRNESRPATEAAIAYAPVPSVSPMKQSLGLVSLVVRDYDEALDFYVGKLGFVLVEDLTVPEQQKRWVVVAPPGATESRLLLARASTPEQESRIGSQTGGRVFLFLYTDDFWRDYERFRAQGIVFVREPKEEPYGTVAVFKDLYGNLWDLVERKGDEGV